LLTLAPVSASLALEGKLVSAGSDTLGGLSSLWAERLRERYPGILVQVRAIGSGAAPTALVQGAADVGPMSRPMAPSEQERFFRRFGYAPTAVPVAYDRIAVVVHRSNPVDTLTLRQLDAMFSTTRRCGNGRLLRDWSEVLDARSSWSEGPISLYGRSAASGTYSVFREQVLCGGDFAPRLNRLVGSSAIVRAVARDRSGIGYASGGSLNVTVKAVTIVGEDGQRSIPLSRALYLYLNRPPGSPLNPLVAAYIDLALSADGQGAVARAGYTPLPEAERRALRRDLGLADD
jgi:phosphate transport system substrate-binding protein